VRGPSDEQADVGLAGEFHERGGAAVLDAVPRPRLHLIRFHGVLPRNAKPRAGGFDLVRIDLNVNASNTCWSERPQARSEEPLLAGTARSNASLEAAAGVSAAPTPAVLAATNGRLMPSGQISVCSEISRASSTSMPR
jgi:hypothetical protein